MDKKKVTIYAAKEYGMGYHQIEARLVGHGTSPYAQYTDAPWVEYVPKGARKTRKIRQDYEPTLVIVAGWNQPDVASAFLAPEDVGGGVSVARGRYSGFDSRWDEDFNAMIAASSVEIIADYRGHNSHGVAT